MRESFLARLTGGAIGVALILASTVSVSADSLKFTASPTTLAPGESTVIHLIYTNTTVGTGGSQPADALTSFDLAFTYDSTRFSLSSFVNGADAAATDFGAAAVNNLVAGQIRAGNAAANGINVTTAGGSYDLLDFTVTALANAPFGSGIFNLVPRLPETGPGFTPTDVSYASGLNITAGQLGVTGSVANPSSPGNVTITVGTAAVPSPASFVMWGLGLGGAFVASRVAARRRKVKVA